MQRIKEQSNIYGILTEPHQVFWPQFLFLFEETIFKKYFPEINDFVIGTIKAKIMESYIVDIGSSDNAVLGFYDFEGATKRNRPILNVNSYKFIKNPEF